VPQKTYRLAAVVSGWNISANSGLLGEPCVKDLCGLGEAKKLFAAGIAETSQARGDYSQRWRGKGEKVR